MALHLASKQVMPFAFAVKGIPFGKASLKLKAKQLHPSRLILVPPPFPPDEADNTGYPGAWEVHPVACRACTIKRMEDCGGDTDRLPL